MKDLRSLPDPDFDHYFKLLNEDDMLKRKEISVFIPIEVSRGCMFRCAFCGQNENFKGYRIRPPVEVADSLKRLSSKYKIPVFKLVAQTIVPKAFRRIAEEVISQKRAYKLSSELRAGMSKEDLSVIKRSGINEAQIGIEALNSRLLKKMKKGTRLIDNLESMKFCEEVGIRHNCSNLLLDFPTESQRDIDQTIEALEYAWSYMPLNISWFIMDVGSEVYKEKRKYGVINISDGSGFGAYLPRRVAKVISLSRMRFTRRRGANKYRRLLSKLNEWKAMYEIATLEGISLLSYVDMGNYLRIDDRRRADISLTLEGTHRDLYLFCDRIRSFDEIKKRFRNMEECEIRKVMKRFYRYKVMYTEDDDWLSLAIHALPENRRHMVFL